MKKFFQAILNQKPQFLALLLIQISLRLLLEALASRTSRRPTALPAEERRKTLCHGGS